jgi:hypothetical protein
LLIWCVVGFCAGIGLFLYGFKLLQRRRLILDTPFSKIRSASMGMVEISGLADGPYTLIAPVTSRACYYYRTLVWEWKQSGKNKQWVKIAGECMHVPFFVDDNTGHVLVDPRGADLDLHRDFEEEFCDSFFTTDEPVPGNVRSFLARHGVSTNNKIKVEEFCIKPKNALFILGTLAENPGIEVSPRAVRDAEPIHSFSAEGLSLHALFSASGGNELGTGSPLNQTIVRQEARDQATVIRLSPDAGSTSAIDMDQQQKIAAALMKAGISNPAAWSAAGVTDGMVIAEAETSAGNGGTSTTAENGFESHPAVVLMKGTNNKTFLISWRGQQEVARSLGWKCTLMIWAGPLLALLSLYVFLQVENLF